MFEIIFSFIDYLIISQSLSSELESLAVLFGVLREAPNSHNTYIQILEGKLAEQVDGEVVLALLRQGSMVLS